MKNLLFSILVCFSGALFAQDTIRPALADSARSLHAIPPGGRISSRDSAKLAKKPSSLFRKIERRKFDSTLFSNNTELTNSDYLENMEKIFQLLSSVPEVTSSFVHLPEIEDQFDQEDSALGILKDRIVVTDDRSLNIRNLQMFNTLLDELNRSTGKYAEYLAEYDKKIDEVRAKIGDMRKDTLMLRIFRDSALKDTFQLQLQELKAKWRQADSLVKLNTAEINDLKARASANSITIGELTFRVDTELKEVGNKAFGKEKRYLWEPRSSLVRKNFNKDVFQKSIDSEQKLVKYYFANTRGKRFWLLITGLVFFFWVWFNFRTLKKLNKLEAVEAFGFTYISARPWVVTLIFVLSLAPLFDLHAPAIYIESTQFLLMLLLTLLFRKRLERKLFFGWCLFILLFLLQPITRILGLPVFLSRWVDLVQDSLSVALGLLFFFSKVKIPGKSKVFSFAVGLYIFFNLLAVVFNLFGRVSLSQIAESTGVYGLAQTISLAVFVRLVVESFLLQIQTSRVRKKYPEQFEFAGIARSVSRFSTILAVVLWLIVFTINLNTFDFLNDLLTDVFTDPRQVGSFSFTLGGAVLFLGIIWLANFLQKYIAYFFGDVGDDASFDDKGQRSRLMVTRLILLILGFLLAIAASGLPVDRITVIIGALGVGIGLGLQSIVNNFVSGVILIFDRPLRIGDTVELGDKKGRVKDISIRSSTLITEDGAEVIIPNGDVLSHNIVNWTLSNSHVRATLSFTIDKPTASSTIDVAGIRDIIRNHPNVLESRDPEIVLNTITSKSMEVKVFFWCKDIGKAALTSGEIRTGIYDYLEQKGITVE